MNKGKQRKEMMKASEIKVVGQVKIEMPNTDELAILYTPKQVAEFVAKHGDIEVVDATPPNSYPTYAVPSFEEGRKRFIEIKRAHCKEFGSN